jgi:hypothetical protein
MVELVVTLDSKSSVEIRAGSSPVRSIKLYMLEWCNLVATLF